MGVIAVAAAHVAGATERNGAPQPGSALNPVLLTPLHVRSASLIQSGQQLTWTVRLAVPFSPAALARDGRSLCLLIERLRGASVTGRLCVLGPRPGGRAARLAYQPVTASGPGRATMIAATVSRGSRSALTATFLPAAIGNSYQPIRWQVASIGRLPGCTSTAPGPACTTELALFPSIPALAALHEPQVIGCVPSGPAYVTNGPSTGREIALTFDDGPWYDTPQFLDILERYKVPATFFEIGRQIATYGEGGAIERRMLADGDMIGDHTWSHPDIAGAGVFAQDQIEEAAAAIRTATGGFTPCLLRAPYGDVSPALIAEARSLGFTTIQWDIDPRDWALPGVTEIYDNVIDNAHPGAIVIQHDGGGNRAETLAALPMEITTLRARGYTIVTVTQLHAQTLIYR